jgi:hypothetical protein
VGAGAGALTRVRSGVLGCSQVQSSAVKCNQVGMVGIIPAFRSQVDNDTEQVLTVTEGYVKAGQSRVRFYGRDLVL